MQNIANEFRIDAIGQSAAHVTFDAYYKLRLSSKKLTSGKCQVKFYATVYGQRELYGYVLVDADQTLREVVERIREKLVTIRQSRDFHQIHLFSIGKRSPEALNFLIFDH
ncbi:MAG: hypothetical protein OEY56_08950 [Cyclobacteriaceae bacterium]|nr:hypothetical protein [Cyclobacteriaceae bacterium]